ncbi:MAG: FkbM family methyltransferase [Candidatus Binatus sp.]|uniref:FkbM family methyltransferase n=1 Tax=Candidatus Binatus sp. TaxID=2811406 RepID=UPI002721EA6A|nr:FkbM family methyltransferase [Candidatus Binatus sp.]MDO8431590.1 FkbM family methyltransferase [Candidatus Binatus sp.]
MSSTVKALAKNSLPRPLWKLLRLARVWSSTHLFPERIVKHTYGGFPLSVWLADPLAQGWYDHEWPELAEIALLRRGRLKTGARVFDLGAHQCVVAMMMARIVGESGQVIALEANRHNAEIGERNRELNGITQLKVIAAAAAKEPGSIDFSRGLNGSVDSGNADWGKTRVRAHSIDELARLYGAPDVIFIDVEGFECEVLKGARETLLLEPDAFIEVHAGCGLERFGGTRESIFDTFSREQYDLFAAPEKSGQFSAVTNSQMLPSHRFFFVALCKRQADSESAAPQP